MDCRDKIGEGAAWYAEDQAIYWLDVPMPSLLHRLFPATGRHETWDMPEMISAIARRKDGSLLIASQSGLNLFDPRKSRLEPKVSPERDQPLNRANDSAPDAASRFWLGTMMNNLGPNGSELPITGAAGAVWRVEPDFSFSKELENITITNGIAWSPDNRTMYVADSAAKLIHAYDFDIASGKVSNSCIFSAIEDLGYPDGAAVDSEGCLWSARWEGECVARFRPDGSVDFIVPIPASLVTSLAFGGPDLRTVYVTTARQGATPEAIARYPQQGGLFAFEAPVAGLPRPQFAG
jgi:sugar lactone lactonase YvrE